VSSPIAIPEIELRPVTSDDIAEILIHRRRMFEDMGYREPAVLNCIVHSSRPNLEHFVREGSYVGWFAVTRDQRVAAGAGLLISRWLAGPLDPSNANRAYLWNVYTYPEFRRRGLARLLTQKAIDYCREQGHRALWLHASEYGRPVYKALGFEQTNEMKLVIG